uniref:Ovule protein n=1 Tax=Anisakis simplex TaxID=6269 RepID=A0A0M3JPM6_ANISI
LNLSVVKRIMKVTVVNLNASCKRKSIYQHQTTASIWREPLHRCLQRHLLR